MSGFLGDLSESQSIALDKLKELVQDIWKDDFTDNYLLRWLRARDFDVVKAASLLRGHLQWRDQNDVDNILQTYRCPEVLKRHFPGGICNHDREGNPIYIMPAGSADFKGILQCVSKDEVVWHVVYIVELLLQDMKVQTEKLGRPVEMTLVITDYDGFSLRQAYCWQAIELLGSMVHLYENHYPEILKRSVNINAPSFFPLFWKLVRPWFTQRTVDKMEIYTRTGWKEALFKYVDPSELPVHLGGQFVSPRGDAMCSDMIVSGGEVPQELYAKAAQRVSADPRSKTCCLGHGEKIEVPVNVVQAGSILEWKLQTKSHDIGLGVFHLQPDSGKKIELLEVKRVKCDIVPECGKLKCSEAGTYIFKFDNGFSWFTKKDLSYVIEIKECATKNS